jgi:hypothetical protein
MPSLPLGYSELSVSAGFSFQHERIHLASFHFASHFKNRLSREFAVDQEREGRLDALFVHLYKWTYPKRQVLIG